jgi:hypothetical protein
LQGGQKLLFLKIFINIKARFPVSPNVTKIVRLIVEGVLGGGRVSNRRSIRSHNTTTKGESTLNAPCLAAHYTDRE